MLFFWDYLLTVISCVYDKENAVRILVCTERHRLPILTEGGVAKALLITSHNCSAGLRAVEDIESYIQHRCPNPVAWAYAGGQIAIQIDLHKEFVGPLPFEHIVFTMRVNGEAQSEYVRPELELSEWEHLSIIFNKKDIIFYSSIKMDYLDEIEKIGNREKINLANWQAALQNRY